MTRTDQSTYQRLIREDLAAIGEIAAADPRHIEAWMRLEHGTLDALSPAGFRSEVKTALACVREAGTAESERLAASLGVR
jgi:hypothetical protein